MVCIRRVRRLLVWALAILSVVALASCSDSQSESSPTAASETSTPRSELATAEAPTHAAPVAPAGIDIARLAEVGESFPPDFAPGPPDVPSKQAPEYAHLVGDTVSWGRPFTVDPPQCRPLLAPVAGRAGADKMGVGAEGPGKQLLNVSVSDPVTVPAVLPSTGCDRMSFHVEDDAVLTYGTVERLPAPNIDGATTSAIKVTTEGWEYVEYYYIAILDGGVFTQAMARVYPDFRA